MREAPLLPENGRWAGHDADMDMLRRVVFCYLVALDMTPGVGPGKDKRRDSWFGLAFLAAMAWFILGR